jgi:hypothetical protein
MVERLQPGAADLEQRAQQAEGVAAVAAVMRRAKDFQDLVQRQRVLVRQFLRAKNADHGLLSLATEQDRIRDALEGYERELRAAAAALSADFAELQASAVAFANALAAVEIGAPMAAAAQAARVPDILTARDRALAAQRALEALLSGDCQGGEAFAGMCQGELSFRVPDPLAATCRQIMAGLGLGQASGAGAGGGSGNPQDGFSTTGPGLGRDIPVFGKPRSGAAAAASSASAAALDGKGGRGSGREEGVAPPSRETREAGTSAAESPRASPTRGIHPRYRDALRRYYAGENP